MSDVILQGGQRGYTLQKLRVHPFVDKNLAKFACMKQIYAFVAIVALFGFMIMSSCVNRADTSSCRWESGSVATDRLLTLADHLESPGIEDWDALDSVLRVVAAGRDVAPAASLWAEGRLMELNGASDDSVSACYDMALAAVDSAASPYLYNRIRLDRSRLLDDPVDRAELCAGLLDYFAEARDSLRITLALFNIQDAYSQVWDEPTQIECLREIKRFTPDSLSMLRDIMDFNIMSMMRHGGCSGEYRAMLDSMLLRREMMEAVPEIGVMVFTDMFRITGDRAFMDTAAIYVAALSDIRHPAAAVYDIYCLRLYDMMSRRDEAEARADEMEAMISDAGIFNIEIARELLRHYIYAGDTESADRMRDRIHTDSLLVASASRAGDMSRIKAARDMAQFSQALHREHAAARNNGLLALVILLILLAGVVITVFLLIRRSHLRQKKALEATLHKTNCELAAVSLRPSDDDSVGKSNKLEGFEAAFTRVRPGFTEALLRRHPRLTAYELRLSSLLSIGLDTKEIAWVMNIQPDSVKKSRQRLRARLGIPSDMTFVEYFTKLDS